MALECHHLEKTEVHKVLHHSTETLFQVQQINYCLQKSVFIYMKQRNATDDKRRIKSTKQVSKILHLAQ